MVHFILVHITFSAAKSHQVAADWNVQVLRCAV